MRQIEVNLTYHNVEKLLNKHYKVHHLIRDIRHDQGDDGGYIVSIIEREKKFFVAIIYVCYEGEVYENELFEDERREFKSIDECQDYLKDFMSRSKKFLKYNSNGDDDFRFTFYDFEDVLNNKKYKGLESLDQIYKERKACGLDEYSFDVIKKAMDYLNDVQEMLFYSTIEFPFSEDEEYNGYDSKRIENLKYIPYDFFSSEDEQDVDRILETVHKERFYVYSRLDIKKHLFNSMIYQYPPYKKTLQRRVDFFEHVNKNKDVDQSVKDELKTLTDNVTKMYDSGKTTIDQRIDYIVSFCSKSKNFIANDQRKCIDGETEYKKKRDKQ